VLRGVRVHSMKPLFALAAAVLALAGPADACSLRSWDSNDLVENTPVVSANGRFLAVVRWWPEIPDFTSERAGKVMHLDDPPVYDFEGNQVFEAAPRPEFVTAALYDSRRSLIREVAIKQDSFSDVLVSDSGQYLVAYRYFGGGGCYPEAEGLDPLLMIIRGDGARVATIRLRDAVTPWDVQQMNMSHGRVQFALRHESDRREVVVLSINGVERRVDVETGALLDEVREIYPRS